MAMQTQDECAELLKLLPKDPKKGFWDKLFSLLFKIFTSLGYGKLIETGLKLVERIANKAEDAKLISEGLENRIKRLAGRGYKYLNEASWPAGDVGPYNYFNLARLIHCKKYFLPALMSDQLNGLTSFYNGAVSLVNPTTELLGPGMIFHKDFVEKKAKSLGYTDINEIINVTYPFEQKDSTSGGFNVSYNTQEKFVTDSKAVVVLGYDAKPKDKSGIVYYTVSNIFDKITKTPSVIEGEVKIDWSKR